MEVCPHPEWPPEQVPAKAATVGPALRKAATPSQYLLPTRSAAGTNGVGAACDGKGKSEALFGKLEGV
jgi:hypothetical protein